MLLWPKHCIAGRPCVFFRYDGVAQRRILLGLRKDVVLLAERYRWTHETVLKLTVIDRCFYRNEAIEAYERDAQAAKSGAS